MPVRLTNVHSTMALQLRRGDVLAGPVQGWYTHGIRSERRLCEEVRLNLAYRWFCRLDLTDPITSHSDPSSQWTAAHHGPAFFA